MAYGIINADTMVDSSGGIMSPISSVMRNRIINGACVIDQRNAGASVTPATGAYLLDRWNWQCSQASKFTVQQNAGSVTPPVGFNNYMGFTVSSAVSIGSTDFFYTRQPIEGFNTADLGWGTANAKTVTLSFQVYSSLTGTFGGALVNGASNYSYPFTYTIPTANTWTTISITIAGPTAGTWIGATNAVSVYVDFSLGMGATYSGTAGAWASALYASATGATSVVGTSGATWYVTGVQLEKGSSATGFEYVNYQTSLANCQRYYVNVADTLYYFGYGNSPSSACGANIAYPVPMRTSPTVVGGTSSAGSSFGILSSGSYYAFGYALPTSASSPRIAGYTASAEL
jgi:hypothetical protein